MKEIKRNGDVIYIKDLPYLDLVRMTNNASPRCDECNTSLTGRNDIMLIPIINEAVCPACGKQVLKGIGRCLDSNDKLVQNNTMAYYVRLLGM